jgi:hypothetical protein
MATKFKDLVVGQEGKEKEREGGVTLPLSAGIEYLLIL